MQNGSYLYLNVTEEFLKLLVHYFVSDNHLCGYIKTIIHLRLSEYHYYAIIS